jgi:hypothetical protein
MTNPKLVTQSMFKITSQLIGNGLSVEQNFPSEIKEKDITYISWGDTTNLSIVLKNIEYQDIYNELLRNNNYNIKLIDGALIQMMYTFKAKDLISHRLGFFPSPNLETYQNDPELYERQELYGDIIAKNISPVPIRFDFNLDEDLFENIKHPKSHLTLGQYKNCRIPVSGPISPDLFIDYILRNFYSTAFYYYNLNEQSGKFKFERTISSDEEKILHLNIL